MSPARPHGEPVTLGGTTVAPGTRAIVDVPVATLYTHAVLNMPVQVVNGSRPGPTLFVSAAVHGDEINGVEIIRRLLQRKMLGRLRGTLLAVPVVNVHGFLDHSRYLPDRRDLNRSFPGSPKGSVAARLAHRFMKEVVLRSDCGIDLHTGTMHRANLPQIRASLDQPGTGELARAFGAPVILDAAMRDGSLRGNAAENGIPVLVYEAGEALRFDEFCIRAGLRGILNVMSELGMLPRSGRRRERVEPTIASASRWVRAPFSGIVRAPIELGQRVIRGQRMAVVSDPLGDREEYVLASESGIVIGRSNLPLAHEGDALFNVASFERVTEAEETVEEFAARHDPNFTSET
ncbi:succinylglutamate desuccinylase/aspartoacylase family protein [Elongatibacter sediminis]|uniref:Succinylglutamate desuccinylase/aspartoacylase family protein n=1 Tax=Elongatibacter sediminis TaxID=3119006 RepID=A0AAW9RDL7_9GAMM